MLSELRDVLDEAHDEHGPIAGYVLVTFHEDGSIAASVNIDEGDATANYFAGVVDGVLSATDEVLQ